MIGTIVRSAIRAAAYAVVIGGIVGCASPGDRCQSSSDCGGDLVCFILEVDGGPSTTGICTHPFAGPGGYCRVSADCASELLCSNELPSDVKRRDGTCLPLRELGESCASNDSCQPPLECALTADEMGTCEMPPAVDAGTD